MTHRDHIDWCLFQNSSNGLPHMNTASSNPGQCRIGIPYFDVWSQSLCMYNGTYTESAEVARQHVSHRTGRRLAASAFCTAGMRPFLSPQSSRWQSTGAQGQWRRHEVLIGGGGRIHGHPKPHTPRVSFSSNFGHFFQNV